MDNFITLSLLKALLCVLSLLLIDHCLTKRRINNNENGGIMYPEKRISQRELLTEDNNRPCCGKLTMLTSTSETLKLRVENDSGEPFIRTSWALLFTTIFSSRKTQQQSGQVRILFTANTERVVDSDFSCTHSSQEIQSQPTHRHVESNQHPEDRKCCGGYTNNEMEESHHQDNGNTPDLILDSTINETTTRYGDENFICFTNYTSTNETQLIDSKTEDNMNNHERVNEVSWLKRVFLCMFQKTSMSENVYGETLWDVVYSIILQMCLIICFFIVCDLLLPSFTKGVSWTYGPKLMLQKGFPKLFPSIMDSDTMSKKYFSHKNCVDKALDFTQYWDMSHFVTSASKVWSRNNYFLFPVKSHLERMASFSSFRNTSSMSILKLSQLGFHYTGQSDTLQCTECLSIVRVKDIVTPPSDKKYHASVRCSFATTGEDSEVASACESVSQTLLGHNQDGEIATENENKTEADVVHKDAEIPQNTTNQEESKPGWTDVKSETAFPKDTQSQMGAQGPEGSKTHSDEHKHSEKMWVDQNHYMYEAAYTQPLSECDKKKEQSDLGPISTSNLTLDQIPTEIRHDDIKQLMLMVAKLTVNMRVHETSSRRPFFDLENSPKKHFGTGMAFMEQVDHAKKWMKEMADDNKLTHWDQKKWSSGRTYSPSAYKSEYSQELFYFSITTNKHVVFDNHEAMHTEVDFFYDSKDTKGVVSFSGVAVKHSQIEGLYQSHLICQTNDRGFIKWLYRTRQELKDQLDEMPEDAKKMLINHCFVVFHPCGSEKKISFGKSAVSKYSLINDGLAKKMNYLSDKASLSRTHVNDLREVLLYNAPTCPGSSGSPVFSFRKTGENQGSNQKVGLSMWIHNGIEKVTNLGGSVMKTVDPRDQNSEDPLPLQMISSTLQAKTTLKKGTPPLYPEYYTWESRLSSFDDPRYKSKCSHTPAELAVAGFFFNWPSSDCVRCFYCGLGLKAWRHTDDIYEEHKKARSGCRYLKLCQAWTGNLNLDILEQTFGTQSRQRSSTSSIVVSLLQQENRLLKLQQTCKMCFRHEDKEMFLPCGEVLTCNACTEIISTCPSCNKKVEATVSVFLS